LLNKGEFRTNWLTDIHTSSTDVNGRWASFPHFVTVLSQSRYRILQRISVRLFESVWWQPYCTWRSKWIWILTLRS